MFGWVSVMSLVTSLHPLFIEIGSKKPGFGRFAHV
uniref:Uncharacterized protein n=1 Tax=Arundo donax TaxID=35708 RepID=A0A0A8ZZ80_ARUDO